MAELPPTPKLHAAVCGDQVCISTDEAVALTKYIAGVDETRMSLARCPLVHLVK